MKKSYVMILLTLCVLACACVQAETGKLKDKTYDRNRIRPYLRNPRYWQYKGHPVLLLGGTKDDNLFQIPDLKEHLDLLASVGGNYIRNTMSARVDRGFEVQPFKKLSNGKYDLDQWNDEYWNRFERTLKLTWDRDIIVQIEVWAFHDFNKGHWEKNPWRPANNTSYDSSNTTLKEFYGNIGKVPHDFFFTVPKLNNDGLVLAYQQKFVDKMLSHSLRYGHVLYCMTNEIHPQFSPEWGWYWSEYIKGKAAAAHRRVETTEMYWEIDLKKVQQRASLDRPDVFSFFEASQNSAKMGQQNWDNLQFAHHYLARKPRPINHVKIYGADAGTWKESTDRHATECFWRNIMGGSASSRFHRPPYGLGLSKKAQAHIKSMRMLTNRTDLFACEPHNDLLSDREPNEAYCLANPGKEYAVFFPNGGEVVLDIGPLGKPAIIRWLEISASKWGKRQEPKPAQSVTLRPPESGPWVALLVEEEETVESKLQNDHRLMQTSTFARSHPFVFFTRADIPALQAKVSQDGSRSKKAYDLFFTGTPTLDLQKMGGLKHEVFYQKQLLQVALKYTITGDTKYADRAISGIDRAMEMYNPDTFNWEDTGWAKGISDAQKKMVGSWLWGWGFGEVTRAVAVTYDIVYDRMTAAKRAQVLDWLERVCHHFKNNVNDGGRRDVLHNHTLPPYAAMAFTCWIIRDDTTDDVIKNQYPSYANDFIRRWYDTMYFQPNGDFTESALYNYFGADTCFSYSAALHINNEPDIISGTSAYNVLKFIGHGTLAYQEENGFPILPGYGDSHERYDMTRYSCALVPILISQDPVQLFYYMHSIDDLNNMQSIDNITEDNGIVNNNSLVNTVLFYPESLREQHPHDAGVPDGRLFLDRSGIGGSAALRSGWDLAGTGKDTVTVWFVNRYNRVNHNHHDMNAIEMAAYGEYFLIDPLHELYASPRHGTSLGHNHIIIDDIGLPSSQALTGGCHADCSTLGEIHGFTSGDGGTVLRGDARYSYIDRLPIAKALDRSNIGQVTREDIDNHAGPLDKAERVFGLINGGSSPPYSIIIDEIKQDDARHKYDFRLHTYKSLSGLGTPANPFIADGTDADLYVTLVQPEAFTASTGEYGERKSYARVENNNMINAVQHGVTGHFFAILYPRKNGMPNAAISSSAVKNGVGAVVSWGSAGSDILLEKRSGSLVSYSNAVSEGRFASVRVQSGSVASYLLLEGETLSYNGTTLVSISGGGSASSSVNGTIASVDAPGTSGFSVYAPAATTMLLNGSKMSITRKGDYVVFGDGGCRGLAINNRKCNNTQMSNNENTRELNHVSKNCCLWPHRMFHGPIL